MELGRVTGTESGWQRRAACGRDLMGVGRVGTIGFWEARCHCWARERLLQRAAPGGWALLSALFAFVVPGLEADLA